MMNTIALVDFYWAGHHQMFFKHYTKILLELGQNVLVFCPEPSELTDWINEHSQEYAARLSVFTLVEPQESQFPIKKCRPLLTVIERWKTVASAIEVVKKNTGKSPDLVFFMWLDSYLYRFLLPSMINRIFAFKWAGLYFHPRHLRVPLRFSALRRGFLDHDSLLRSSLCRFVAVLDEGIVEKMNNKLKTKQVLIFPDITDESSPDNNYHIVKEITNRAKGKKIIGLIGSLDKRKGLLSFLRLTQLASEENWFFVMYGQFHSHNFSIEENIFIESVVASTPLNCFFQLEAIPNETCFNSVVNICDVMFAVYQDFYHSSNLLTKSALFKKPVMVSNMYCMGERVRKFNLGICVDSTDVVEYIKALHFLLEAPYDKKRSFEEYLAVHSQKVLYEVVSSILISDIFDRSLKNL